jgi:hypothetical protein
MSPKGIKNLAFAALCLSIFTGFPQNNRVLKDFKSDLGAEQINWSNPYTISKQGKTYRLLNFDHIGYVVEKDYLPYLRLTEPCKGYKLTPQIEAVATSTLTSDEESSVNKIYLTNQFEIEENLITYAAGKPYATAKLIPLRINKLNGKIEKLTSYRVQWEQGEEIPPAAHNKSASLFTTTSVLSSGKWYKIGTTANGIYKLDHDFLQQMGVDVANIDPHNIRIYGNGGEILSENNADFHYDDLNENAIYVQGESDNTFDAGDYVLFYGQAPGKWKYSEGQTATTRYVYNKHYYSDTTYYFLTVDMGPGKRVQTQNSLSVAPTYVSNTFDDFLLHESDAANLIKSGRELYGENFDNTRQYSFGFNFPGIVNDTVWVKAAILGRRVDPGTGVPPGAFDIIYPGGTFQVTFPTTCADFDCDVGKDGVAAKSFINSGSSSITVTVNCTYSDESGWLNYVWMVARRSLSMSGSQMTFRDYRTVAPGAISQFNLQSGVPNMRIWNVTDPINISEVTTTFSANNYSFILQTDSLLQFIAFDGTNYKVPSFTGLVPNQNLHSLSPVDYIIVAHPWFLKEAQDLADLHQSKEGYSHIIVTPDQIYNEFSSGAQDITAIRQFTRMLYKRALAAGTQVPRYMMFLGDGSYLQKDRNPNTNTNFIPTFQTQNSSSYIASKTSDDFFGFLDDNEGLIDCCGNPAPGAALDIGIGRLPVHSVSEAEAVSNKIIQYYARKIPTNSCCDGVTANEEDWRNWVCLIADDANPGSSWETTFFYQSENFSTMIANNKRYNIDKIYEDAYQVVSVPGGRRYPDVVTAINNRMARGALLIGYSGHGGELGLSHEEIITINQIQAWNNINNMPLFFTATCEFSRYDDPDRTSAGEYVILNANGGGIALFTTTRLAFASDGNTLGGVFYPTAVNKLSNGKYPALGDIIKQTKFLQPDFLHFALLGDPGLTLSYPKEETSTSKFNSHITVANVNDTLNALGKYTIEGFVCDTSGNKITSFNGTIYPSIFDKPVTLSTLDNSGNGATQTFQLQKNVIYRGKASVTNGDFKFSFISPKDIFYNYGRGKISYFAQADTTDAAGYYSNLIVGGTSSVPINDNQGPAIKLFMNNAQFVVGGLTNENPYVFAEVSDSSGVNTTGNGLGHDIVATVDANTAHSYILNDYYQADMNRYQSGQVKYQITGLSDGAHHLDLKVWDILNNSSTSSTDFVVAKNAEVALAHVLNYPNPFTTATKFFVEHNQACDYLNIEVQIFTITGTIVKTIQQTVKTDGFRTEGIAWDGRDEFGDKLGRGVYIYKVTVKNENGSKADKIEKLVILN